MNERPAYWGVGLGLGLALAGGVVVADAYAGVLRPGWWALYPSLILAGIGTVVTLAGLGKGLSWALDTSDELAARREQRRPPAPVELPEPEPDDAPETDALEDDWYIALRRFFRNGEVAGGFSHSRLVESGSITEGPWTELTRFYASEEGGQVLRLEAPEGYVRGRGWTFDDIKSAIAQRRLPHPPGEPPEVVVLPDDATRRDGRRQREGVKA